MFWTILLVVLILLCLGGGYHTWPRGPGPADYGPSGVIGTVLVILLVILIVRIV